MTTNERDEHGTPDPGRAVIAGAALVVIAIVAAGVLRAGTPEVKALPKTAHKELWVHRTGARYPYGAEVFSGWVQQSYSENGGGSRKEFFAWFDSAWQKADIHLGASASGPPLTQLQQAGKAVTATPSTKRTEADLQLCQQVHRAVKKVIPLFSLDRGFEFANVPIEHQRQCFLQSVLIAGMLQRAGLDAGVVMVWKNPEGKTSNNGHAATLVRLPDGSAVVVDASEPRPFAQHQGLYGLTDRAVFVRPVYLARDGRIRAYTAEKDGARISVAALTGLNKRFITSQFAYYRGERAPGGILSSAPTKTGLSRSAHYLQSAALECPDNALAVYMLGRVYGKQGRRALAAHCFTKALDSYERSGWIPDGPREAARQASVRVPALPSSPKAPGG